MSIYQRGLYRHLRSGSGTVAGKIYWFDGRTGANKIWAPHIAIIWHLLQQYPPVEHQRTLTPKDSE